MGRRGVEVVVELLDIFAVVPLRSGETKETLLKDRILAIPEGQAEAETSEAVA